MISFSEIVIYSVWITHVVADCVSFATTFYKKSSLIHSVAPPFQIEPAALGFDLVLGADLNAIASILFHCSTPEHSCSGVFVNKSSRPIRAGSFL